MQINIAPETERLIRECISSGYFRSVDEVIQAGVEALREKNAMLATQPKSSPLEAMNLNELFARAQGLLTDEEVDTLFRRNPSTGRPVDLE